MEHMEGRIGNVIVDGLDEKIQNSYSLLSIQDHLLKIYCVGFHNDP